jgi:hypothetical protein
MICLTLLAPNCSVISAVAIWYYQIHKKRNGDVTDAILLTISPKGRK